MVKFDINSVAIIGAGPAGLAALYEFLHTSKEGKSTVGTTTRPTNPLFSKIVVFEQKSAAGGIWTPVTQEADLPVPPQQILDTESYHLPEIIRPRNIPPQGIEDSDITNPKRNENRGVKEVWLDNELEWSRSGIYPNLFTNIPARFTRFSFMENEEKYYDTTERKIYPFMYHQELSGRFSDFIKAEKLDEYVRVNSTVENLIKNQDTGKWDISIRKKNENRDESEWYLESFDAVVIANGHYTVPFIPNIPGMAGFNAKFPGVLMHAKSFRDPEEFKDLDVLVIGGGISTINLLQYIVPIAKSTTNSKRGKNAVFPFINDALVSDGIIPQTTISKIDPETGLVHFDDGSTGRFDKILLSTGYHFHFPFLQQQQNLKIINPGNASRVQGLYLHTFNQQDPTLATIGVAVSQLNFHTMEASAAAIAGVWSGLRTLPTVQEQKEWERQEVEKKGDSIGFHYFNHFDAGNGFIDTLEPYFPEGRFNPLQIDGEFVGEVDMGKDRLRDLFYGLKDKKIPISDTVLPMDSL
ncbi:uncharacterized protein J8A68_002352 [[Candida] subhashii]|uniref:Thiol-specific monooxygenase n=1 Tax=[Candida] subhashii TaxID=561895 RepID=A0A8J5UJ24_9ASCO|nr:uncharacterized protein J8A68_002352 [[Candida] subhashii]KAG7664098.1 hypothetical protein J8A68_002352 [[Candida] subhashii]